MRYGAVMIEPWIIEKEREKRDRRKIEEERPQLPVPEPPPPREPPKKEEEPRRVIIIQMETI